MLIRGFVTITAVRPLVKACRGTSLLVFGKRLNVQAHERGVLPSVLKIHLYLKIHHLVVDHHQTIPMKQPLQKKKGCSSPLPAAPYQILQTSAEFRFK